MSQLCWNRERMNKLSIIVRHSEKTKNSIPKVLKLFHYAGIVCGSELAVISLSNAFQMVKIQLTLSLMLLLLLYMFIRLRCNLCECGKSPFIFDGVSVQAFRARLDLPNHSNSIPSSCSNGQHIQPMNSCLSPSNVFVLSSHKFLINRNYSRIESVRKRITISEASMYHFFRIDFLFWKYVITLRFKRFLYDLFGWCLFASWCRCCCRCPACSSSLSLF